MPRLRSDMADSITRVILERIENYELKSGDIISDTELAAEFGVSRTPVREAIFSLIDNGVLERKKTKVTVAPITLKDIEEITDVRDAIEQKAVELIIAKGGPTSEQFNYLEQLQKDMKHNIVLGNIKGNFSADHLFHTALYDIADNQRLRNIHNRLLMQSQRLRWLSQLTPERFVHSCEEHEDILKSIQDMDVQEARRRVHIHLENTLANYRMVLSSAQWINMVSDMQSQIK